MQLGGESGQAKDAGYDYPTGLVGFVARGCGKGATADITLYFYGQDSANLVLRKWQRGAYSTVPGATIQQVSIGNSTVAKAIYKVTDGSSLDDDGTADGNIVDPIGLGISVVGAPNTGIK